MKNKWLLCVRYNLSGLKIYSVETDDLFRCIGHLYSTSIEKIDRVDYVRDSEIKKDFWATKWGYEIIERNDLNTKKEENM